MFGRLHIFCDVVICVLFVEVIKRRIAQKLFEDQRKARRARKRRVWFDGQGLVVVGERQREFNIRVLAVFEFDGELGHGDGVDGLGEGHREGLVCRDGRVLGVWRDVGDLGRDAIASLIFDGHVFWHVHLGHIGRHILRGHVGHVHHGHFRFVHGDDANACGQLAALQTKAVGLLGAFGHVEFYALSGGLVTLFAFLDAVAIKLTLRGGVFVIVTARQGANHEAGAQACQQEGQVLCSHVVCSFGSDQDHKGEASHQL